MPGNVVSEVLRAGLYTRTVGRRIVYFRRLSSTMDEAVRLAREGAEEGTTIVAGEQTAGRGRFQRSWVSQPGNLYLSVVLRPSIQALQYLSILSCVAVVRTIRKTTGLHPTVKWPNDVRIGGKKVCGILVENTVQEGTVEYAIAGIGINVTLDPSASDEIAATATSLNLETQTQVDAASVLRQLLQEMDRLYGPLRGVREASLPAVDVAYRKQLLDEWRSSLETLGSRVEVRWQNEVIAGDAEDVDAVGNLLLRQEDGTVATLSAGEVTSVLGRSP